jgi:hypothetical protein
MFGDQFMSSNPDSVEMPATEHEDSESFLDDGNVDTTLPGHLVDERVLLVRNECGMFTRYDAHIHYYIPSELLQLSIFSDACGQFDSLRVVKKVEEGFAKNPVLNTSRCSFLKKGMLNGIVQAKVFDHVVTISNVPIHDKLFKVADCRPLKGNVMIL